MNNKFAAKLNKLFEMGTESGQRFASNRLIYRKINAKRTSITQLIITFGANFESTDKEETIY